MEDENQAPKPNEKPPLESAILSGEALEKWNKDLDGWKQERLAKEAEEAKVADGDSSEAEEGLEAAGDEQVEASSEKGAEAVSPAEASEPAASNHEVFDSLQVGTLDAGVIQAKKIVVAAGGGSAVLSANDNGVRIDMTSPTNAGNVLVSLTKNEGAMIALYDDGARTGHNLALAVPNSATDHGPKLQITDGRRGSGNCLLVDLLEVAEIARAKLGKCEER